MGVANQTLAQPLVVRAADTYGNPVPNVTVSWNTPTTCGSVAPATSTTNSSGIAQAQWTLGGSAAACTGGASAATPNARVTFTATVTGSAAGSLSAGNYSDQIGAIGAPTTLTASVIDATGNPVPGVTVMWTLSSGTGVFSAQSSLTDVAGQAVVSFTPGTVAGNNFINAAVAGVGSARYLVWTQSTRSSSHSHPWR